MCSRGSTSPRNPDVYLSLTAEVWVFKFGCESVFVFRKWLVTQTLIAAGWKSNVPFHSSQNALEWSDADPWTCTSRGSEHYCDKHWSETAGQSDSKIRGPEKAQLIPSGLKWNSCKAKKKKGDWKEPQGRGPLKWSPTHTQYFPQRRSQWPPRWVNK